MNTSTASSPEDNAIHAQLRRICRWSLGLVWIWEGLVPKILWPTEAQRDLVERSGLFWPSPEGFLQILGIAMVVAGIILCIGWLERLAVLVATVSVGMLIILVVGFRPESLSDMHGGIAKDACLFACAYVVWALSPRHR